MMEDFHQDIGRVSLALCSYFKLWIKIMNNYTMSQTKKWKVYLYLMMFAKLVMF